MKTPNGDTLNYQWYCEKNTMDETTFDALGEALLAIVRYIDEHLPDYAGLKDLMDDLGEFTIEEMWYLSEDSPDYDEDAYNNCDESQMTNEAVWWGSAFDLLDMFGLITVNDLYPDIKDEAHEVAKVILTAYFGSEVLNDRGYN